jgi:DNA polymerase III delta prime subunit
MQRAVNKKKDSILKNDLINNRTANSYLLIGDEESCVDQALKFIKSINCKSAEKGEFCDNCRVCKAITNKVYAEMVFVESKGKADFITIDNIKELQDRIQVHVIEAEKRVCILKSAEKLNREAGNAFLKTLEEPPGDTIFILTTTNSHEVLGTIVSRCRRFFVSATNINLQIIKDEFYVGLRNDIINILSANLKDETIIETIENISNKIKKKNQGVKQTSLILLNLIESFVRDLIVLKECGFKEELIFNKDKIEIIQQAVSYYSFDMLAEIIDIILDKKQKINYNLNFKIMFSDILLRFSVE